MNNNFLKGQIFNLHYAIQYHNLDINDFEENEIVDCMQPYKETRNHGNQFYCFSVKKSCWLEVPINFIRPLRPENQFNSDSKDLINS